MSEEAAEYMVDVPAVLAELRAKHKVVADNVPLAIGVLAALQAAHTEYSKRTVRRAIGVTNRTYRAPEPQSSRFFKSH